MGIHKLENFEKLYHVLFFNFNNFNILKQFFSQSAILDKNIPHNLNIDVL